jgi:triosephosphate isomerase
MNRVPSDASVLLDGLRERLAKVSNVSVVVCPPFVILPAAAAAMDKTSIAVGAQNMHHETNGAFTGEISPNMLRDLYVTHVILGHSERRTHFHETLGEINKKVQAALKYGLTPILCVGETWAEREKGNQEEVVRRQIVSALKGVSSDLVSQVVIAYEPVWAIGTGKTATPEIAQDMHSEIRSILWEICDESVARNACIIYGGSVKAANAAELLAQPDIDGGLVGGASLDAEEFFEIVSCAEREYVGPAAPIFGEGPDFQSQQ